MAVLLLQRRTAYVMVVLLILVCQYSEHCCATIIKEGECHAISDEAFCFHVWNDTYFPNVREHNTQAEAMNELDDFLPLILSQCSNAIVHFLCSVYMPHCSSTSMSGEIIVVSPCRAVCEYVRLGCEPLLTQNDFSWPNHLMCDNFPSDQPCLNISDFSSVEIPSSLLPQHSADHGTSATSTTHSILNTHANTTSLNTMVGSITQTHTVQSTNVTAPLTATTTITSTTTITRTGSDVIKDSRSGIYLSTSGSTTASDLTTTSTSVAVHLLPSSTTSYSSITITNGAIITTPSRYVITSTSTKMVPHITISPYYHSDDITSSSMILLDEDDMVTVSVLGSKYFMTTDNIHSTSTKGSIRQRQTTTNIFATTSTIRRTPTNIPTTIPSSAHSVSFGSTILGVFVLIAILVLM